MSDPERDALTQRFLSTRKIGCARLARGGCAFPDDGPPLILADEPTGNLDSTSGTIIAWIVVVVSAVPLLDTLMSSVLDRRCEIGVLRAIGAKRSFTLKAILAEAVGIGIVGGLLGLVLRAAIQYLTSLALTNVLSIDVAWRPRASMILIGLGALTTCLLGSVPPAIRAGRLDIVEAIDVD